MKKSILKGLAIVLITVQVTGCSTMTGRHQNEEIVYFNANVDNVEVNCSGLRTKTPGNIPLKQSRSHACTAEKPGYKRKPFKIKSKVSWAGFAQSTLTNTALWGWWSLGIGTGIGWLVDLPSGAMNNLEKDSIDLEMEPTAVLD